MTQKMLQTIKAKKRNELLIYNKNELMSFAEEKIDVSDYTINKSVTELLYEFKNLFPEKFQKKKISPEFIAQYFNSYKQLINS